MTKVKRLRRKYCRVNPRARKSYDGLSKYRREKAGFQNMEEDSKFEILYREKNSHPEGSWLLYTTSFQNLTYTEALNALDLVRNTPGNESYDFVIGSDY